jgi:PAS domain S-box-containing protein
MQSDSQKRTPGLFWGCIKVTANANANYMTEDTATVLLVDTTTTVADRLDEELRHQPSIQVQVESDLDTARTRAASGIDSLVINLDPLEKTERQSFVTDCQTLAPQCPIILFTSQSPEAVADDLFSGTTTLVERCDDPNNWAFLAEKIQSSLRTAAGNHDDDMYRMLVESARDGLYRLDANGDVAYANESWAQMLGYDRGELLGMHASQAMAAGELERGQRLIQQVLEDDDRESDIIDLEMITKDGDRITVAVHFVVLTTEDGAYDGVMGVTRDVTDQRASRRELEQKNERLDEFASVVSHDLRNPLNVAELRLELLREECDSEHIEAIDRALVRMDTLIDDLRTLARNGENRREREIVELKEVSEQCWQTVETGEATLCTHVERPIQADRNRLQQLLENLIQNAVEHGGDGLTITVGELDDGFYVEDDGSGIPEDDRENVFDAGYSTAEEGTGFGLRIVKQVVNAHDWNIHVTEGTDGGARFEISNVDFAA